MSVNHGKNWWDLLARDVQLATPLPWGVRDQESGDWLFCSNGFGPLMVAADNPPDGLALCFNGTVTRARPVDDTDAAAIVAIADALQSILMDRYGALWPGVELEGEVVGSLTPAINDDGVPVWRIG
ncbi:MAG: hypothetical protein JWP74_2902 [Marmoricola sp.]|nr:hypothetical protein [Marmoricola sp.]